MNKIMWKILIKMFLTDMSYKQNTGFFITGNKRIMRDKSHVFCICLAYEYPVK